MDVEARFREMTTRYLRRSWRAEDGLPPAEVASAERRLGRPIPVAVRAFYLNLGGVDVLCRIHNEIRRPDKLDFEDGYLIFMDENQDVVTWGLRCDDLGQADPTAWQRNNTPPTEWFSEEKSFSDLLQSMFDWYEESGILDESTDSQEPPES
ncbi:hypothetical protein AKJ09_05851 [Labilithrix luteola]|uniref:Knr4/Smi1-like domain-containing protein n=1 Tax=Labilithrix luteola TaxID=1391654 RepID=A0A0K1Q0B0_9BACT|nr:SMI1/KNR4 family protein [Labilithrix luteola]AKU99187.1 hypothetical protein AKJ09_05851 [Labilithrix luteola]